MTIELVVVGAIAGLVGIAVGQYVKTDDVDKLITTLSKISNIVVKSTEQDIGNKSGDQKKHVAKMKLKNEMQNLGIDLAETLMDEAIEASVKEMNKEE